MSNRVKQYFQDYVKWFPEEWKWDLADGEENRELYMKFRARKSCGHADNDLHPFFDSIEKDANQFGREHVTFTDIFGITWEGEKGRHRYVGDADYEQHMYYWPDKDDDEFIDEDTAAVSDAITASEVPGGYADIYHRGVKQYILMEDVVDVKYTFIVENHLFKDSCVVLSYKDPIKDSDEWSDDGNIVRVWDIYGIAPALKRFKPDLYEKFLAKVDEHFKALQESDREEERAFAPTDKAGKFVSAKEYFDKIEQGE